MEVRRVGEHALLVLCDSPALVQAAYAELLGAVPRAADIVPAATTVLVDGLADADLEVLAESVAGWRLAPRSRAEGPLVELPVVYDGPDLLDVARIWGVDVEEVGRRHSALAHVVAFCGFAPGFAYCSGLPDELAVPRLDDPRPVVPAGSVGLAGAYTGIYPGPSPGGWRLIGTTPATLWDERRDPPALLQPGTRVRFVRE